MTEELYSESAAFHLLNRLEHILECDTHIDEVGFIHPCQFASLDDAIVGFSEPPGDREAHSTDEVNSTNLMDIDLSPQNNNIFWNNDHKLAISTQALYPLYKAAKLAFMTTINKYKELMNSQNGTKVVLDVKRVGGISASEYILESEVMKHSKVLLLLSCDFGTAWNARKLIALKKQDFSLFMDELSLSALILSYSPKSEQAWSHRRWVIRTIHGKYPSIQDIVERESELVKKIAEKSKMNYRAWSHRCRLITYMTSEQVLNELKKSRKWAELHVGDSSCFHYRQHLLSRMATHNMPRHDFSLPSPRDMSSLYHIWIEELEWDAMLIKSYIGRESLWVHRRFLCQYGIKHFCTRPESAGQYQVNLDMENFINGELELVRTCLNFSDNEFEDGKMQRMSAAVYILWILKHLPDSLVSEFQEKLRDFGDLKSMLNKLCPEKALVWDGLMS